MKCLRFTFIFSSSSPSFGCEALSVSAHCEARMELDIMGSKAQIKQLSQQYANATKAFTKDQEGRRGVLGA